MGVDVKGGAGLRMAEVGGNVADGQAFGDHQAGGGVAQAVERQRRQVVPLHQLPEDVRRRGDVHPVPVVRGEYRVRLSPIPPERQAIGKQGAAMVVDDLHHIGRQKDIADA